MSTWYSVDLGDGVEAFDPTSKIEEVFFSLFAVAGCPKDMAVFSKYPTETNIVTVYFTPSAHLVAKLFNAAPCEKPSTDGIGLLAGDANALTVFFPDWESKLPTK